MYATKFDLQNRSFVSFPFLKKVKEKMNIFCDRVG